MTDAKRLALVREALGFDSPLDAHDNLLGASMDIDADDAHIADEICRHTIDRVLKQLREVREILKGVR